MPVDMITPIVLIAHCQDPEQWIQACDVTAIRIRLTSFAKRGLSAIKQYLQFVTSKLGKCRPLSVQNHGVKTLHTAREPLPLDRVEFDVYDLVTIFLHGGDDAADLTGVLVLALESLVQPFGKAVHHENVKLAVFGRQIYPDVVVVLKESITPVSLRLVFKLFAREIQRAPRNAPYCPNERQEPRNP